MSCFREGNVRKLETMSLIVTHKSSPVLLGGVAGLSLYYVKI